jgi:HD-like signal output (HDOD) protein
MSLSAKILRLSNSAFYGMPRKITNINEAIVILGFKVINTMVLSLTVFDMFPDNKKSLTFDRKSFWKHSIMCGLLSKLIAEKNSRKDLNPEDAFCAGLLHDIGKIVMEQYLHDDLQKSLQYGHKNKRSFYQSETDMLGYTHSDVAEWLLSRWNLPEVLYYPIIFHHSPLKIQSLNVNTSICHIADYLCYDKDFITPETMLSPPDIVQECYGIIGLTLQQVEEIKGIIPEELDKVSIFFEVLG